MGNCLNINNKAKDKLSSISKKNQIIDDESMIKVDNQIIVNKIEGTPLEYYSQVKKLGEGSYGVVWKVEHIQTGLHRAMKKILKNAEINNMYKFNTI